MNFHSRQIELQSLASRTINDPILDKLLNLKYTPYIKIIRNYQENEKGKVIVDKYYFVISFLSDKGCDIKEPKSSIINGKLLFDIIVETPEPTEDTFSQVIIDADQFPDIIKSIRKNLSLDYIVKISFGKKNEENKFLFGGSNSGGGTTEPYDIFPPGKILDKK